MTNATRKCRSLGGMIILAFTARAGNAQALQEGVLGPFAKNYKVDFSVPDAPAFKLLEVDESAILRPQSVRDLGLAFAGFRGTNNAFVVPKQFGVEVSPGLLIGGGQLRLADYRAKRFLYATRFSGGTSLDTLDRRQLAAGIRFSLVDEQDLRDKGAAGSDTLITRMTDSILNLYIVARERVGPRAPLVLNDDEMIVLKALGDSIKRYWADEYWNAKSIEIAFGARAGSADALGHDPKMEEIAGWATYADGLQGWGQLLLGARFGAARDTAGSFHSSNTFATRLYVGSNALKGFVEGQHVLGSASADERWLVNSGVELRVPNIGWINATAGYSSGPSDGKPRVISSFKFKTAVPGL